MSVYGITMKAIVDAWLAGRTFKVMLLTSSYAYDPSHSHRSDLATFEVAGDGYTPGGVPLVDVAATYDAVLNAVRLTAGQADFGTVDLPDVGWAVVYEVHGSAATDVLVLADSVSDGDPIEVPSAPLTYIPSSGGLAVLSTSSGDA